MEKYAKPLVRISISLVFLWFGLNQIFATENFLGYLPNFILNTDYASTIVVLNGIFETLLSLTLLAGLFVRPVALLLSLHLLVITINLGYNDIAVRDFGLMLVTFAVFLGGNDEWGLKKFLKKQS